MISLSVIFTRFLPCSYTGAGYIYFCVTGDILFQNHAVDIAVPLIQQGIMSYTTTRLT